VPSLGDPADLGERAALLVVAQSSCGQPFPVLPRVLAAFTEAEVSPHTIASWFRTPQPLLEAATPAQWMGEGKRDEPLLEAARRTAARFAH
jgi:hypothetical protein